MYTLGCFGIFYVLGVVYRKDLHSYKRFMLMASLSMISASVTRMFFFAHNPR